MTEQVTVKVDRSITIFELAQAAASIGCVLQYSDAGFTELVRREVKRRTRKPRAMPEVMP